MCGAYVCLAEWDDGAYAQEAKNNLSGEEAAVIKLYCQVPPIAKLDNSLNTLKNCEYVRAESVAGSGL